MLGGRRNRAKGLASPSSQLEPSPVSRFLHHPLFAPTPELIEVVQT